MGIFLYENLDVGYVPPTPATPIVSSPQHASSKESTLVLLRHAEKYGYPIGYIQEQNGQIIQNIVPVHKTEYQQISTSSKTELALHTETAFHPYKPDYVVLFCLRGDPEAVTTYANLSDILKHISPETKNILKSKMFTTGIDLSFRTNGEEDQEIPISIIGESDGMLTFTYDATVMKPNGDLARSALEELEGAIPKCIKEIVLKTGDLLVIDNRKTIHGRKPFQARYDGTDRWVQRVLVRKELPPIDQRDGRIITTTFSGY
jgi:L-asparagine oxygenase